MSEALVGKPNRTAITLHAVCRTRLVLDTKGSEEARLVSLFLDGLIQMSFAAREAFQKATIGT